METKKRIFFPLLITSLGIILCVTLSGIFFSLSKTKKTADSASTLTSISYNIYFLSLNKTNSYQEGAVIGKDMMSNGHSGYVWQKNDAYYVISSAYKNENDANLVKNQIEKNGASCEIIKQSFPSIKISSTYSNKEREIISTSLNSFYNAYNSLYDISISLENNLINETTASLNISSVLTNFNSTKNSFDILFKGDENEFITLIKNYLLDASESLSLLYSKSFITTTHPYLSLIKYRYCELLHINYNLISSLLTLEV